MEFKEIQDAYVLMTKKDIPTILGIIQRTNDPEVSGLLGRILYRWSGGWQQLVMGRNLSSM